MPCESFIVNNVSNEMKERILNGLEASGADIRGNNPYEVNLSRGVINIEIEAYWDSTSLDLEIKVVRKPFLVSCDKIEEKLREEIEKSRDDDYDEDIFVDMNFDDDY
ncbi:MULTISPECIES: hypothetical protein [Aquimarina]|uniref:hypothetical protein n=1 Tax=Aquimarina TaxID=290174 RepID=UPI000942169C|nr:MULTISPECIES: hypothetical protein [Aquimarina]